MQIKNRLNINQDLMFWYLKNSKPVTFKLQNNEEIKFLTLSCCLLWS